MKHIREIGLAIALFAVMGLTGCDTGSNDGDSKVINAPIEANPDTNQTVDNNSSDENNETVVEEEEEEEIEKVDVPVSPEYSSFPIEAGAHALTNNGRYLVYGTVGGLLYSLDVETGNSEFLYDLNDNIPGLLIGGLAYIEENQYYYGAAHKSTINHLDIDTGESVTIANNIFPDGIDLYNGMIYSITTDRSDVLTVFNMDGSKRGAMPTDVEDMVAIAHSENYLYILSEDSDIYQVDPETGESHMVVDNSGFEEGDSFGGVEGLDILDHYLYMTNVNDSTIYRVEIDIRAFE